jgi:hypothetical protein
VDDVDALDEDVADEVLRRDQGEVSIEGEHDELVDARRLDELGLPIHRREQPGLGPRRQHLPRMPVERDRDGSDPPIARTGDDGPEDRLMTAMHAVEETHRRDARPIRKGKRTDPADDVHERRA